MADETTAMGDGDRFGRLSRELSLSTTKVRPEEYIRQTLQAHGFFNHSNDKLSSLSSTGSAGAAINSKSKEKLGGITEEDKKRTTQLVSLIEEGKEVHRLKEPRSLFFRPPTNASSEPGKKLPFWPVEVECISHGPKFLGTPPPISEPFYVQEQEVVSPKIRSGEGGGTTVYLRPKGREKYFTISRAGLGSSQKRSACRAIGETTLVFESRFESGNLEKAVQVGKWDYELYLSFDLYTNKHTQWFYFSVRNARKGQTYRFTIVNLYKAGSLYNQGMQPVHYSVVGSKLTGVGWNRRGHTIKYFKTTLKRVFEMLPSGKRKLGFRQSTVR